MNIQPAQQPQPKPLLTLLAHVDATPSDLEPSEVAEVESFESVARPDTNVVVQLRRESTSPARNILQGLAQMAALPLAGTLAAAAGLGGPFGFVAMGVGAMVAMNGVMRLRNGIDRLIKTKEPTWNGIRTYHIQADKNPKRIDSPTLQSVASSKMTPSDLTNFIGTHMKQFPAQVTAVMLGGHGLGYQECADFKIPEIRSSLLDATAQSGSKPDVLILEACLMGNLEALEMLRGTARYALVSEETMGASGLPWPGIMKNLPQGTLTAEEFGKAVVSGSRTSDQIDTLAFVNLDKVGPLATAFEEMAHALRGVVAAGGRDAVESAIGQAHKFPENLRDVGELARGVLSLVPDKAARDAANKVLAAQTQAVVASTRKPEYRGVTHLTVQGPRGFIDTDDYSDKTGFKEWGALLNDLRPWYGRILRPSA